MDRLVEIKKEYDALKLTVIKSLGNTIVDALKEFYFTAASKVWGNGGGEYYSSYQDVFGKLFVTSYSESRIKEEMAKYAKSGSAIDVPYFYKNLAEKDLGKAMDFVKQLNDLLVTTAYVNGDFTIAEANAVNEIVKTLTDAVSPIKNSSSVFDIMDLGSIANDFFGIGTKTNAPSNIKETTKNNNQQQTERAKAEQPKVQDAEEDTRTLEELLAELDSLIGLESVKEDVHSLLNFIKVTKLRTERGMKAPVVSYHLVFTGNPGTGKTTVARLVGRIYYRMGILPKGQLVETDRSSLVAGYVGQTAIKTQEVIQSAMGGVLFIDEAYSLAEDDKDTFGREAIETILKAMEDHRDELVVIVAGYTQLMHKFIESNPGLQSRFSKYIEFPDYTGEELFGIFKLQCKKNGYKLADDAADTLKERLDVIYACRDENFGNGRDMRNLFEKAIAKQANRLAQSTEELSNEELELITLDDLTAAML
ncbi:MAG: AAA family ATPase [Clostridia bacterium]|nr:AAA family ATPase [Clostridia bacterium]